MKAAGLSIVLAGILGVALGVGRLSPHRWISSPCAVFVEFFRAVPVLIMMIFAYFFYSRYDVFASEYSTLAGVVTGLTLYNGAVIAEIVRCARTYVLWGEYHAPQTEAIPYHGETGVLFRRDYADISRTLHPADKRRSSRAGATSRSTNRCAPSARQPRLVLRWPVW